MEFRLFCCTGAAAGQRGQTRLAGWGGGLLIEENVQGGPSAERIILRRHARGLPDLAALSPAQRAAKLNMTIP